MNEIGSEFNISFGNKIYTDDNIFRYLIDYNTLFLDSGRSCIKFITRQVHSGKVLLPSYICESVISAFKGFDIVYYNVDLNLDIDLSDIEGKLNHEVKILYIAHYFGSIQKSDTLESLNHFKNKFNFIIIEDTTHSIFSNKSTIGDYNICSLRKWFPISDGGVIYSKFSFHDTSKIIANNDFSKAYAMIMKTLYHDSIISNNDLIRKIFSEAEEQLDNQIDIKKISWLSKYLLRFYNISEITQRRKKNYNYLKLSLRNLGIIPVVDVDNNYCPYVFAFKIENRDRFRDYLKDHRIYCPVHWPIHDTDLVNFKNSLNLTNKLISIPIDQRYSLNDMEYIYKTVASYMEGFNENC